MLTLDRLVLREIRLTLREPFRISSGEVRERRIILCELFDRDGAQAWSECVVDDEPNYSPETLDTAWPPLVRVLAPRLLGRAIDAPGDVHDRLDRDVRGHNMAKAALEMGMWGLAATKAGELRALIRQPTDLGERFLVPSGQTVAAFETALAVWTL